VATTLRLAILFDDVPADQAEDVARAIAALCIAVDANSVVGGSINGQRIPAAGLLPLHLLLAQG
jgi:hypothetical protein